MLANLSPVDSPSYEQKSVGDRVFLDVGVYLRAVLFRASHSRRLVLSLRKYGGTAVISPHILRKAAEVVEENAPRKLREFASQALVLSKLGVIERLEQDGTPSGLPVAAQRDLSDDAIVLATALESKCDVLATLDFGLANTARHFLKVTDGFDEHSGKMVIFSGIDQMAMHMRPERGAFFLLVRSPTAASDSPTPLIAGRAGFGIWFDRRRKDYFLGHLRGPRSNPIRLDKLNEPAVVALSYDFQNAAALLGVSQEGCEPRTQSIGRDILPGSWGNNFHLLDYETMVFGGSWLGVLSSPHAVPRTSMRHTLKYHEFFRPLDNLRFPISDLDFADCHAIGAILDSNGLR